MQMRVNANFQLKTSNGFDNFVYKTCKSNVQRMLMSLSIDVEVNRTPTQERHELKNSLHIF